MMNSPIEKRAKGSVTNAISYQPSTLLAQLPCFQCSEFNQDSNMLA